MELDGHYPSDFCRRDAMQLDDFVDDRHCWASSNLVPNRMECAAARRESNGRVVSCRYGRHCKASIAFHASSHVRARDDCWRTIFRTLDTWSRMRCRVAREGARANERSSTFSRVSCKPDSQTGVGRCDALVECAFSASSG